MSHEISNVSGKNEMMYAEYADHARTFRQGRTLSRAENRFKSVLMGQSAQLKARAFDLAEVVANTGEVD